MSVCWFVPVIPFVCLTSVVSGGVPAEREHEGGLRAAARGRQGTGSKGLRKEKDLSRIDVPRVPCVRARLPTFIAAHANISKAGFSRREG